MVAALFHICRVCSLKYARCAHTWWKQFKLPGNDHHIWRLCHSKQFKSTHFAPLYQKNGQIRSRMYALKRKFRLDATNERICCQQMLMNLNVILFKQPFLHYLKVLDINWIRQYKQRYTEDIRKTSCSTAMEKSVHFHWHRQRTMFIFSGPVRLNQSREKRKFPINSGNCKPALKLDGF